MPEYHNEICSSVWVDAISEHIKNSKKGPIYIGNSIIYVKIDLPRALSHILIRNVSQNIHGRRYVYKRTPTY